MQQRDSEGILSKCQEKINLLYANLMMRCHIGSIYYSIILLIECAQVFSFPYNCYDSLSKSTVVSQTISQALSYFRVIYTDYLYVGNFFCCFPNKLSNWFLCNILRSLYYIYPWTNIAH